MPYLRHYKAWITVDGRVLPEYNEALEDDGQTIRCYIPSEEGKEFVVHWTDNSRVSETAGYVYVDGEHCGGRFTRPADASGHAFLDQRPLSDNTGANFQFGRMVLTDDEDSVEDPHKVAELGTIKIVLKTGVIGESYTHTYTPVSHKPVNERAKKAGGGHRVVLGAQARAPQTWKKFWPYKLAPVQFLFVYKPVEMLRAMDIAPPLRRPGLHTPVAGPSRTAATATRAKSEERPLLLSGLGGSGTRSRSGSAHDSRSPEDSEEGEVEAMMRLEARLQAMRERRKRRASDGAELANVTGSGSGSGGGARTRVVPANRGLKRKATDVIEILSSDEEDAGVQAKGKRGPGGGGGGKRPLKRVKVEHDVEERKPPRPFRRGEVIDLTDD